MARVLAPLMSAEARGRVGGLVFNTWRGIRTCRAKTGPAQPRSQKQLLIRAQAIGLARLWQTITQATRDAWNDYAVTHTDTNWNGSPVRLTGLNWYIRINARMMHAFNTTLPDPPSIPGPIPVSNFATTGGAHSIVATWTSPAHADYMVTLYAQGPHSPGAKGNLPKASFKVNASANTATTTLSSLSPGFYHVWARMFDTVTGLVSLFVLDDCTVTT